MLIKGIRFIFENSISAFKYRTATLFNYKPELMQFIVTYRCNSKCVMCFMWKNKTKDIKAENIANILSNKLFSNIKYVTVTGGEISLRNDLVNVVEKFTKLKKIRHITLISNGFLTEKFVSDLKLILKKPGPKISVVISLDGIGKIHDQIRGKKGAFQNVHSTLMQLKKIAKSNSRFFFTINSTVQNRNKDHIKDIANYCKKHNITVTFVPVLENPGSKDPLLNTKNNPEKIECNKKEIDHSFLRDLNVYNKAFWKTYFNNKKRNFPCALLRHSVTLTNDGDMMACVTDKKLTYGNVFKTSPYRLWYSKKGKNLRKEGMKICNSCKKSCNSFYSMNYEFFTLLRALLPYGISKIKK